MLFRSPKTAASSRIITGRFRLEISPVEVANVLRDAVLNLRPSADATRIFLTLDDPGAPLVILGGPLRLSQIL